MTLSFACGAAPAPRARIKPANAHPRVSARAADFASTRNALQIVVDALAPYRFEFDNEGELIDGVMLALNAARFEFVRQRSFRKTTKPCLLIVPGIALDVRLQERSHRARPDIEAYIKRREVRGVLVVSATHSVRFDCPATFRGNPIRSLCVGESLG